MKDYYAMETKNIRGYTIDLNCPTFEEVSLYDYFKENIAKNRNIDYKNMSKEEKNTVSINTPTFLILEKISGNFYEVYTGTQVVAKEDYKNGEGLSYVNKNYGFGTNKPLSLKDKLLNEYADEWILNTDESIKILQSFVNDCRLYSSTSEEFQNDKAQRFEHQEKLDKEELEVINHFEKNKVYQKTR